MPLRAFSSGNRKEWRMSHLSAETVSVAFAGLTALSAVDLQIQPGRISGLIGPNGAGKTTLVNVLTGFQSPTEGAVKLDGASLAGLKPHQVRRKGIARTFQGGRLFRDLAVVDNLEVTGVGLGMSRRAAVAEAEAMLEWMGIGVLGDRIAGTLPYTDERRVAIGRALMGRPSYILLDEPAAGMSGPEAAELSALIRRIAHDLGCGVLLIEHNVGLVLGLCEHVVVLDSGAIIEEGAPAAIRNSEKVRHAYMGTAADTEPPVEALEVAQ
ncbi:MAG TPA: ABC transporter ATP-binding protein [Tianweitania sediminis]|nr:ABC transporter ATP-binding protein [Tianweitania sediminis]